MIAVAGPQYRRRLAVGTNIQVQYKYQCQPVNCNYELLEFGKFLTNAHIRYCLHHQCTVRNWFRKGFSNISTYGSNNRRSILNWRDLCQASRNGPVWHGRGAVFVLIVRGYCRVIVHCLGSVRIFSSPIRLSTVYCYAKDLLPSWSPNCFDWHWAVRLLCIACSTDMHRTIPVRRGRFLQHCKG